MVNDIQRSNLPPQTQAPASAPPPEKAMKPETGAGLAESAPVTMETAVQDTPPETAEQDCEAPKTGAGGAHVSLSEMFGANFNIFAFVREHMAEAAEAQNENARKMDEMATDQLSKLANTQKDIADGNFNLDRIRGFFKIGGGVSQGLGSAAAGKNFRTPTLSTAYNTAGGSGDSIGSGFEGVIDAGKQKAISLMQTIATLYQANQQKSESLHQKQDSGFDKLMQKQDELNQLDQSTFGESMDALRNPV